MLVSQCTYNLLDNQSFGRLKTYFCTLKMLGGDRPSTPLQASRKWQAGQNYSGSNIQVAGSFTVVAYAHRQDFFLGDFF